MGRPRKAWDGKPVANAPSGFPLYSASRRPRVVTSDVWAYMKHVATDRLPKAREAEAVAFIDQAFEFFQAADNPQIGSRPLLYYYSFLNLAKMALLVHRVRIPPAPKHGIADPRANIRTRLRVPGQTVRIEKCAQDHSQIFPEFVRTLGGHIARAGDHKVVHLLAQIPGIHRTYCQVTREPARFLPVKAFTVLRDQNEVWVRLTVARHGKDVRTTLPLLRKRRSFKGVFDQVESQCADELWFETGVSAGGRRATDTAIRELAKIICGLGIWSILTLQGTRFYLCTLPHNQQLPGLASIYAVMFYLGSLTRYKPADFDKIITHKYSWLVAEFLQTQPAQYLYGLASFIGGVEVVRPFAVVS